jgi:hypothetical protein
MAKKDKTPLTFEELARQSAWKEEKSKLFRRTFLKAFAVFAAFALVFLCVNIAFTPEFVKHTVTKVIPVSSGSGNVAPAPSGNTTPANTTPSGNGNSATPADNGNTAPSDNGGSSSASGLSNSSSVDEVVSYFNTALNKVKPNAKQIILVKEENTEAGGIEGLPGMLTSVANSLISGNMGVKAENQESNANDFPVENESWSSQLTAADIKAFDVKDDGSNYVISLDILDDEPSDQTAHGYGHNGKVFSVIMPSIVTENAGPAKSMLKSVKTGHQNGRVIITVDKASGNVIHANYFFQWKLVVQAMGATITVPFGLEKDYSISY